MKGLPTIDSPYETYEGMNHDTYNKDIWVDYNGWRMKDLYAIELTDGTIIPCAYPNGNGWSAFGKTDNSLIKKFLDTLETPDHRGIRDENVVKVKLLSDEDATYHGTYWGTGESRDKRNQSYFGGSFPDVIKTEDSIEFKTKRFFSRDIFGNKILKEK